MLEKRAKVADKEKGRRTKDEGRKTKKKTKKKKKKNKKKGGNEGCTRSGKKKKLTARSALLHCFGRRHFGSSCSSFLDCLNAVVAVVGVTFSSMSLSAFPLVRCVQFGRISVVSGLHDTWLECCLCLNAPRALCLFHCMRPLVNSTDAMRGAFF